MDYEIINQEEYVQTGEGGTALSYNHKDGKTLAKLFTPGMGAETARWEHWHTSRRGRMWLCTTAPQVAIPDCIYWVLP